MSNSNNRTIFTKLRTLVAATLFATSALAIMSTPARAATIGSETIDFDTNSISLFGGVIGWFGGTAFEPWSGGDIGLNDGVVPAIPRGTGIVGTGGSAYFAIWKPQSAATWAGVTIKELVDKKFLSSQNKVITMKVKSAEANVKWLLKLETAAGSFIEKSVTASGGAGSWLTLNFDFNSPSTGTFSSGAKYTKLTVIPDYDLSNAGVGHADWGYGTSSASSTKQYFIDDISYATTSTEASPCTTSINTCSSRIDWSGSTGVIKGYHNLNAEYDISVKNSYYAQGVGYYQAYVKAGTTFKLKFIVKDKSGNIRPNLAVSLRANKAYSGSTAHWSIDGTAISPAGTQDGGVFDGFTDSNGYVEFTITNTDTNAQPVGDPTKDDSDLSSFGSFALLQDSADTTEAMDIIELHAYGLGFKIGENSSYNAGQANGYIAADGSAVIQVPIANYNSAFSYSVSASKGEAYLAGRLIVVTGVKDGEATTISLKMTDGTDTATKSFGARFTSTLSMKSPASITYDAAKKTVTCNNATYTKAPTDTAYYLYVNRVLKGGKKFGTTTGLQWMHREVNLSTEGATAASATWNVPASWNTNNIARVYCETQAFSGNDEVRSLSSGFTIPRLGKYIPRTSAPAKLNPSSVTMRLVEPTLTKDASGKAVNYYDWTWNSLEYNWAQYYGKNLAFIYKYMSVGATTTLKWKVTDTDSGSALDNFPVSLIINKNYGGAQNATFSYVISGEKKVAAASPSNNGTGETVIAGMTDDEGYVTFVITNTNTAAQAEAKPTALNAMQPAGSTDLHSQITLTAGLAQTKESIDLLEFHIVKP